MALNPHQKNKVDVNVSLTTAAHSLLSVAMLIMISQSLSPDEQRLFRLYGKLPSKADHLAKVLKERKYFDSGDYALSKAGKAGSVDTGSVGSEHPLPENIPHLSSPNVGSAAQGGSGNGNQLHGVASHGLSGSVGGQSGSPVKESSFLNRETSADELERGEKMGDRGADSMSPPPQKGGIPIRR